MTGASKLATLAAVIVLALGVAWSWMARVPVDGVRVSDEHSIFDICRVTDPPPHTVYYVRVATDGHTICTEVQR